MFQLEYCRCIMIKLCLLKVSFGPKETTGKECSYLSINIIRFVISFHVKHYKQLADMLIDCTFGRQMRETIIISEIHTVPKSAVSSHSTVRGILPDSLWSSSIITCTLKIKK